MLRPLSCFTDPWCRNSRLVCPAGSERLPRGSSILNLQLCSFRNPLSWIQSGVNEPYMFARNQTHWGPTKTRILFYLRSYYFHVVQMVYWWVKYSYTRKMYRETTLRSQGSLESTEQREPDGLNQEAPFPPGKFKPRGIYWASVVCKGKGADSCWTLYAASLVQAWCFYTLELYRAERSSLYL